MGIKESLLNTITAVSDSDFVRLVTSAGTSSKATVQNLFKSFESNLGAKSSLTTSDYIRVVGSDDASYKQKVSNVMSAMGLDALKTPSTEITNVDTATTTGFFKYGSSASGTKPTASGGCLIVDNFSATYTQQVAIPLDTSGNNDIYKRVIPSSGTPTAWVKMPTRAEVDALTNSTAGHSLAANSTVTITLSKYFCAGTLYGAVNTNVGFAYTFGNGYLAPIKTATGVTATLGSDYKTITVTNSNATNGWVGMSVTSGATVTMS